MKFNIQKFLIAVVCACLGGFIGYKYGHDKAIDQCKERSLGRGFGLFPFFDQNEIELDPSHEQEIEKFKSGPLDKLKKFFGFNSEDRGGHTDADRNADGHDDSIFGAPFSFFTNSLSQVDIETREDDQFVYIDINLEKFDKNSLNARVEGSMVIIEGNQKSEENGHVTSSHFSQQFPVPEGTDPSRVDMVHNDGKLILKFPKIKEKL